MTEYMWAEGHDVAQESLTAIAPQPRTDGIRFARRSHLPDGTVQDDGPHVVFEFDFRESDASYQTLLASIGLDDAKTVAVTVYCKSDTYTWVRKNGTAVRPAPGSDVQRSQYMLRKIEIMVRDLEDPS